mmetsp:Transcript_23656/g.36531  ORF Transcript_23656/g.36531 Transcript_23656/m.36531 type:complete len:123 (+) Transcript_23656:672-1040(+)
MDTVEDSPFGMERTDQANRKNCITIHVQVMLHLLIERFGTKLILSRKVQDGLWSSFTPFCRNLHHEIIATEFTDSLMNLNEHNTELTTYGKYSTQCDTDGGNVFFSNLQSRHDDPLESLAFK